MKPSIESKVVAYPMKGRLWLPPDCEPVEVLIGKLWTHHAAESKATHRGLAHTHKHELLMIRAADALRDFIKLNPNETC